MKQQSGIKCMPVCNVGYSVGQGMKQKERLRKRLMITWHLYPYVIFCFVSEALSARDHIVTFLSLPFKVSTE